MDIIDELRKITERFDQEGIDYALCGGLAMAIYALPRATMDIDILIRNDSLTRARKAVEPLGFTIESAPMVFHGGKIEIFRLSKIDARTHEILILDLLMVGKEADNVWKSHQEVDWEGRKLKVVSPEGLIHLKSFRASGKDQDDIKYLRSITDED